VSLAATGVMAVSRAPCILLQVSHASCSSGHSHLPTPEISVQDPRLLDRRLTAHVVGLTLMLGLCAGCSDDGDSPPTNSESDSDAAVDAGRAGGDDGSAPSSVEPSVDAAASTVANASSDAANGETLVEAGGSVSDASGDAGEVSTEVDASTSTSDTPPSSSSDDRNTSAPLDTSETESTADVSAPTSGVEIDAGSPPEPDATIVLTTEDWAGSEQGGGADGIDDAKVSITLEGAIASLLIAEADESWQVTNGSYWWSQPGYSIPPSTPVLGGYTTEWNLYVEDGGYAQMTDRSMSPLAAGTHELDIYLSWYEVSQPAYFVLVAFDDEGSILSTSRLIY